MHQSRQANPPRRPLQRLQRIARTARAIALEDPTFLPGPFRFPADYSEATAIDTLLAQVQSVITRLDAIIQNKYRNLPDKLAAWKSASHVERAAKKTETSAPLIPPTV